MDSTNGSMKRSISPDPNIVSLIFSVVRGSMQFLMGMGLIGGAYVTDSNAMALTSVIVAIGMLCWGVYDKILTAKAMHATAVKSAELRTPLKANWRTTP